MRAFLGICNALAAVFNVWAGIHYHNWWNFAAGAVSLAVASWLLYGSRK